MSFTLDNLHDIYTSNVSITLSKKYFRSSQQVINQYKFYYMYRKWLVCVKELFAYKSAYVCVQLVLNQIIKLLSLD